MLNFNHTSSLIDFSGITCLLIVKDRRTSFADLWIKADGYNLSKLSRTIQEAGPETTKTVMKWKEIMEEGRGE